MRLLVRRGHSLVNDLRFSQGPVYIGRQPKCQVFLPDRAVSRQHAVIVETEERTWMVHDLGSANRTLLNNRPVAKMPLHEGDIIGVADFSIEVHFAPEGAIQTRAEPLDLGDTLIHFQTTLPSLYASSAKEARADHVIHLSPARMRDFYNLDVCLGQQQDQKALLTELTRQLLEQFNAYHAWAGLRETTNGPLTSHGGLSRGGNAVSLEMLAGRGVVKQAMNDQCYILLPKISDILNPGDSQMASMGMLGSALAAPIIGPSGAYGIIYLDNGFDQSAYTRQDLDYLTLVSTHLAALVEHIG